MSQLRRTLPALDVSERSASLIRDITLVIGCSILIALTAKLEIPLFFTPVPIIVQDTLILLCAVLFGSRRGAAIAFSFVAQGASGLPVFGGGVGGMVKLLGPTGGYLIGYVIAAFVAGWVVEKLGRRTLATAFLGFISGSLVIFTCGVAYLSTFVGFPASLTLGVLPFIPGNLLKTMAALRIVKGVLDQ